MTSTPLGRPDEDSTPQESYTYCTFMEICYSYRLLQVWLAEPLHLLCLSHLQMLPHWDLSMGPQCIGHCKNSTSLKLIFTPGIVGHEEGGKKKQGLLNILCRSACSFTFIFRWIHPRHPFFSSDPPFLSFPCPLCSYIFPFLSHSQFPCCVACFFKKKPKSIPSLLHNTRYYYRSTTST